MSIEKAREHIDLARKQWDDASVDSWEPEEPESCVSNVFYAYENLIVAVGRLLEFDGGAITMIRLSWPPSWRVRASSRRISMT